ncbi:MAG: iron-sulfur cluster assembly protein, partial [Methylomonas sp.]
MEFLMVSPDKLTVEKSLRSFIDPNVETDLVSAKSVKKIDIDNNDISVEIELG